MSVLARSVDDPIGHISRQRAGLLQHHAQTIEGLILQPVDLLLLESRMQDHIRKNAQGRPGIVWTSRQRRRSRHPNARPIRSSPPSDSIALAICGADILSVPLVRSDPVMLAAPARPSGSTSAPVRTSTSAARIGNPGRSATITRNPFSSLASLGCTKVISCGADAGGGRIDAANRRRRVELPRRTRGRR